MSHSPAVSVAPQPPPMPTPHDVGPAIDAYLEYARDYLGFSPATPSPRLSIALRDESTSRADSSEQVWYRALLWVPDRT